MKDVFENGRSDLICYYYSYDSILRLEMGKSAQNSGLSKRYLWFAPEHVNT